MPRLCLMFDLKDDPKLIAEYVRYHESVWPEVTQSLRDAGILEMEIYLASNRLFMVLDTVEGFSFEEKLKTDAQNPKVCEWETLMANFQQPLPWSKPGEKWQAMNLVFKLTEAE
jgi:L-rhamnose mutarotase